MIGARHLPAWTWMRKWVPLSDAEAALSKLQSLLQTQSEQVEQYAEGNRQTLAAYEELREKHLKLQAENDKLRANDARYRWLRSTTNTFTNSAGERIDVKLNPEEWDAAIDAAIEAAGDDGEAT